METADSDAASDAGGRGAVPGRLGEMLIRDGVVTSNDVQEALALQANGSEWRLGRILVRLGALDDLALTQALSRQFHVPTIDLRVTPPNPGALARLPRDAALQLQALPISVDASGVTIAVADPPTRELRVVLERACGAPICLVLCPADELSDALEYWYSGEYDYEVVLDATTVDAQDDAQRPAKTASERDSMTGRADHQVIESLLAEADRQGATAVHLDYSNAGLVIRYRTGHGLVPGPRFPPAIAEAVRDRLIETTSMCTEQKTIREGEFEIVVKGRPLTCRVAALVTPAGEHVFVRMRPRTHGHHLGEIGVHGHHAQELRRILDSGRGVVAVGGLEARCRERVCRVLLDEIGTDERLTVLVGADEWLPVPLAIHITPESGASNAIEAALALNADVIGLDGIADTESIRRALDASSKALIILGTDHEEPVHLTATLVDTAGALLVAGTLRAIVVAREHEQTYSTAVHIVNDDTCRAILDIEDATSTPGGLAP